MDENGNVLELVMPKEYGIKLPDPTLLEYYKDIEKRRMWINFDIDDTLFEFTQRIYNYNAEDKEIPIEDRKPIYIYIMSYGGCLENTFAFISACLTSKTPIITVNCGISISAGGLIFLAGSKRYTTKFATVMIHSGSTSGVGGTYEQTVSQQKNYNKTVERMKNYILERTGMDSKIFNKHKAEDWYIYADEMLKLGIATDIIENIDDVC